MDDLQPGPKAFKDLTGIAVRVKIVDIGANPLDDATPYDVLLRSGCADVVGFEPNPEALDRLNQMKGPNEIYLPMAVADGTRRTINFCQAPGMTSLLEPNPAVLGLFHGFPEWGKIMSQDTLDTVRLDDIPETAGVNMIKIDIQGGELMALENAASRLKTTLVIQTEVEFLPMYVGQPLFSEVEMFLRRHGFMLHRFYPSVSRVVRPMLVGGNIYSEFSQLLWADAIFVRDFTNLAVLTDEELLQTAKILHDCYGSFDLALHLLLEHDKRTGAALGGAYLGRLVEQSAANA